MFSIFAQRLVPLIIGAALGLISFESNVCADGIQFVHTPPRVEELPTPGRAMKLKVTIQGAPNLDGSTRAFVVGDGRLMELPLQGVYNESDDVVYTLDLWSPLAELSYQFVYYPPQGTPGISQRYALSRPCLPNWKLTDAKIDRELNTEPRVKELIRVTRDLDIDLKGLEYIVDLLAQLRKQTQEG